MIFFVFILLLIIFSAARAEKRNEFNRDYIARDATSNIKGIFVILILFSHAKSYLVLNGPFDEMYMAVQEHLNQMVVAMFLFYSGYGIMEQIKKREFAYILSIPKKRFPNLLLNYDLSVLLYIVLWLILRKPLTLRMIISALVAWNGIGNSDWYIFIILCLYIITFISFFGIRWFKKRWQQFILILALTALSVVLVVVIRSLRAGQPWWYNTLILYALGFWYSFFKEQIEKLMMKNDMLYLTILAVTVVLYILAFHRRFKDLTIYSLWGILFTLGLTFITMKVKIESNLLKWFGEHVFSIYILQRIPMNILSEMGIAKSHRYIFVIISIAVTCVIAEVFDVLTGKLSAKIWKPKEAMEKR